MIKFNKRIKNIRKKINIEKEYDINEAIFLIKKTAKAKFIESIDVSINLGINTKKSDQNVRGSIILPKGTGRIIKIAVFTQGLNIELAKKAGADFIGTNDLAEKIKNNKIIVNSIIASPDVMHIVSKLGKILGPRGLMPNPKFGTVTDNIQKAIKNAKSGQIYYKNDKNGIIHTIIGKSNFLNNDLKLNLECLILEIKKNKPTNIKGLYIKKITISTTMGVGIKININSLNI
ncbi:50S ribosomal protein L1 [Sodalis-like secondary symbiont of Drepanosiphum platanoidis]|uniref:50S ribosomal protein L1 n=1 Tax=Sodalis-like secondary symbiont of Drepanosiphum platanoidis TaxID=2994493 RepID=UPI003464D2EF